MSAGQTKLAKSPRVTKKRVFLFAVLLIVSVVSMWVHPLMMVSADPNTADVGLSAHYVNGTAVRAGYILVVAYSGSSIYEDGYFSTNFQFNVGSAYTIHGGNVSNAYFDYWLTPGTGAPVSGAVLHRPTDQRDGRLGSRLLADSRLRCSYHYDRYHRGRDYDRDLWLIDLREHNHRGHNGLAAIDFYQCRRDGITPTLLE